MGASITKWVAMKMEDGNSAAELQRDHAEQKRLALVPTGDAREQWLYEWTTRMMDCPDLWATEIAINAVASRIEAIMGYSSASNAPELLRVCDESIRAALRTRAEEAFADYDFSWKK
jgi:hypothetical protein